MKTFTKKGTKEGKDLSGEYELVEVGALWENEGSNGPYFGGNFGEGRIVGFVQTNKKAENGPDIRLYLQVKKSQKKETDK